MDQTSIERIRTAEKDAERAMINAETKSKEIIKKAQLEASKMISDAKDNAIEKEDQCRRTASEAGKAFISAAVVQANDEISALTQSAKASEEKGIGDILSSLA